MDSKSKGMAWINQVCQTTETFFTKVEDLISQEPLKYVENELLTVGENVKQFCSEFIQDVFDLVEEEEAPSSPEVNEKVSRGLSEEHQKVSRNLKSSVHELLVKEFNNDLPIKMRHDIEINMGIEENEKEETLLSSEIQEVIASANDISLSCGMRQPNTVSNDSKDSMHSGNYSWKISESSPTLSVFSDVSDCTEQGMSTTSPISKLKLGDSCIIVDQSEICSASECEAKHLYQQKSLRKAFSSMLKFTKEQKHNKKAAVLENHNIQSDQPRGRYLTPASASGCFESMNQEFSESEWEII